jgi:hypothetical protein
MIRKAAFKNFRGFASLELSDICGVTLISGRNNMGKSSVLEGIFLLLDYWAPNSFALLNEVRGISYSFRPEDLWDTLFHNLNLSEELRISLNMEEHERTLCYTRDDSFTVSNALTEAQGILKQFISSSPQSYSLKFSFQCGDSFEDGHFIMNPQGIHRYTEQGQNLPATVPVVQYLPASRADTNSAAAELFGKVTVSGKKDKLISYLKLIDSSISDVSTVASGTQSQLYAEINGKWLPFRLAGDGFDHMLMLISSMIAEPNSILLADEIETGFHYSVYKKLWDAVMLTAREEHCQVIATTHSYECIESAAKQAGANGMQDDFCYFRLGRNKHGDIEAHRYSHDMLDFAVKDNMEVR